MSTSRRVALVVDDSAAMRAAVCTALADMGFASEQAEHGADALRRLAEARYDLIITDLHMPLVDGLKLIGLVRAGGAHQRTGIIVLTAEGTDADLRRALGLGANAVLKKPVQRDGLADAVRSALQAAKPPGG